eukprot:15513643-Heterocapsa_arctica.AAC.1
MPADTDSGSSSHPYIETEDMNLEDDAEAAPVADVEVIPLAPPPLCAPPWLACSIDTIEHNR